MGASCFKDHLRGSRDNQLKGWKKRFNKHLKNIHKS